jgi:hypothetical protein
MKTLILSITVLIVSAVSFGQEKTEFNQSGTEKNLIHLPEIQETAIDSVYIADTTNQEAITTPLDDAAKKKNNRIIGAVYGTIFTVGVSTVSMVCALNNALKRNKNKTYHFTL